MNQQAGSADAADAAAALSGVRVLEVGTFMAAPFGTMQLADLGAEVVKVENPGEGDPVRKTGPFVNGESSPFARLNRNKRSLAVNLKDDAGKQVLQELLRTSDVVVENLRPGTLARLGFGYEDVRTINQRVVYVSASGWGQDGPLAALPGLDIMAQARSGLMSITGMPGGEPTKVGVPVCDLVCALYVALATVTALRVRDQTGVGQYVDVSLFEAGVSLAVWEAGRYFATGEVGGPLGSAHQTSAPYQAIRTADGWVTLGAITPKTWTGMCEALGLQHLLEEPEYADAFSRHGHRDTLIPQIEEATRRRTTTELVAALDGASVPCAPISDMSQVFTDDHLSARDFFWDTDHPAMGLVKQIGSPMRFSATPTVRHTAGPQLGADTDDLLAECGIGETTAADLRERGIVSGPQSTTPVR